MDCLSQFLQNQSLEETIEVLDDMLYLLVLKTDFLGLSPLAHIIESNKNSAILDWLNQAEESPLAKNIR